MSENEFLQTNFSDDNRRYEIQEDTEETYKCSCGEVLTIPPELAVIIKPCPKCGEKIEIIVKEQP